MAMNDRIQPGTYFQYPPSGIQASPYNTMRPSAASMDRDGNRYLAELLAERQKLGPFMQVLPFCSRLLNQEIVRASGLASNQGFGDERFEHGSPLRSGGLLSNGAPMDLEGWLGMQTEATVLLFFGCDGALVYHCLQAYPQVPAGVIFLFSCPLVPQQVEKHLKRASKQRQEVGRSLLVQRTGKGPSVQENGSLQRINMLQDSPMGSLGWHGSPGVSTSPVVTKVVRVDVPVDKFPNYNFVGRLLGPRGNSLKRVEATTQCRVYIRGRGSVKDSVKEEKLRDKPGYEHLNEPLHVLVEAKLPANVIDSRLNQAVAVLEDLLKPVDESLDYYKKQQLRELALLNGTLREESPHMSPSASPFNSSGMKRAKTGR